MKKILLSLIVAGAVVIANSGIAQTGTQQIEVNSSSKAVITIDKDVHDYGTIEQGANGECTFTVTNTGTEPLIISLCKGSCGCTVPACPQEPIAPGASAKITVKYDTNRVGPINKSVTITSNASNEPTKTVRITGNITAKPVGGAPINTGGPANN